MSFEGRKETTATRGSERRGRCEREAGALGVGPRHPSSCVRGNSTTGSLEGAKEVCMEREGADPGHSGVLSTESAV